MSHSPDLASWRCTNWLRCSSADSGNPSSLAERPLLSFCSLNSFTDSFCAPDVSLPVQYVTAPFAPSMDAGSMTFAPSVEPDSCVPLPPPPPPSSSSPQAPTRPPISATQPSQMATCPFLLTNNPPHRRSSDRFWVAPYPSCTTCKSGAEVELRSTIASGIRRLST